MVAEARPVTVNALKCLSPGIFLLSFRRDFSFKAGQVIAIGMEHNGPRRLYSICSGEEEEEIQILFNEIIEGYLTPRLSGLRTGDRIWITPPRGEFLCGEAQAFWIAAGTGIAPFYAMLRSGQASGKTLIRGARFPEQFHFHQEITTYLGENYISCCSGDEAAGMFHGRVTAYLSGAELPPGAQKYYLCGSAEMVVDTRDILIQKGVPFDAIISEIYF